MRVQAIRIDEAEKPKVTFEAYQDANGNWFVQVTQRRPRPPEGTSMFCTATYSEVTEAVNEALAKMAR